MSERRRSLRLLPRQFRERLLLAMVALVVGSQVLAGVLVSATIREDSLTKAAGDLEVGRRVFRNRFESRTRELLESVRVLAADFGFKEAVATRDTETIAIVLENHGARIGADLVVLLDNAGRLIAATRAYDAPADVEPFPQLRRTAQRLGEASSVAVVGDRMLQMVAVPVRAPVPVAWVMMGFDVDGALAAEMATLTGLQVSFAGHDGAGSRALVSTLPVADQARLPDSGSFDASAVTPFYTDDGRLLTVPVSLPVAAGTEGYALLQLPRSTIESAYRTLQGQFLVVLLLTLGLAILVGIGFASGISRPVQRLIGAALGIQRGDYQQRVDVRGGGELALLAEAFNAMQSGIAERESQIRYAAEHDELTDLPNRGLAEQAISERLQQGRAFSILLLSIKGFRTINDTLGYDVGDEVLCALAARLREVIRDGTDAARIGGDEFMVVVDDAEARIVEKRAAQILQRLGAPIEVDGSPVAVNLCVGIVISPDHGEDANRLLRRADIAAGNAKRDHVGIRVYAPGQDEQHLHELRLMRDLAAAIETGGLHMVYQPKVRADSGAVEQAEALVRWEHPELGFVSPEEFVFLAERAGLVQQLTMRVLDVVLDDVARWRDDGIDLVACVNLSAHDVADPNLVARIAAALHARDLRGEDLVLEITESAVLEDPERAVETLGALRASGIELAIDDYGTGYSSLEQLRRLPVTELKIDKSFVMELEHQSGDQLIVQSTIALSQALGLAVVAEGLETPGAWRLLEAWGCDRLQGYFVSRPLKDADLREWLRDWDPQAVKQRVARSRSCGMMRRGWLCLLLLAAPALAAENARLAVTGGVSSFEGAAGGGIVPWALIGGYASRGEVGGSLFATRARLDDLQLDVVGAALAWGDRMEFSVARQTLGIEPLDAEVQQDLFGAKLRLVGRVPYTRWPQITAGAQFKRHRDFALAESLGAADDSGVDIYLAASKLWFSALAQRNVFVNLTGRSSAALETGLMGFDDDRELLLEASAGVFVTDSVVFGAEYRQKHSGLDGIGESDWRTLFVAWFPVRHLSVTAAWLDLGDVVVFEDQQGWYLSLEASL